MSASGGGGARRPREPAVKLKSNLAQSQSGLTLDLLLNPRLKPSMSEAFLREARRAGVPLADIELLSFDAEVVGGFLEAARERRAHAFLATVDRRALEAARYGRAMTVEDADAPSQLVR